MTIFVPAARHEPGGQVFDLKRVDADTLLARGELHQAEFGPIREFRDEFRVESDFFDLADVRTQVVECGLGDNKAARHPVLSATGERGACLPGSDQLSMWIQW